MTAEQVTATSLIGAGGHGGDTIADRAGLLGGLCLHLHVVSGTVGNRIVQGERVRAGGDGDRVRAVAEHQPGLRESGDRAAQSVGASRAGDRHTGDIAGAHGAATVGHTAAQPRGISLYLHGVVAAEGHRYRHRKGGRVGRDIQDVRAVYQHQASIVAQPS